jgi:hypothetical protein
MRPIPEHRTTFDAYPFSPEAAEALLGIPRDVPLTIQTMARQLRVTFFPHSRKTPRLELFVTRLHQVLTDLGAAVVPWEQAFVAGGREKLQDGMVIIAAGEMETGRLPVNFVGNLRRTTIVGIVDAPCPAGAGQANQEKLDSIVQELSWNIVQVVLFVEETQWTICTMNGAIIPCRIGEGFADDVEKTLISKVAAPVVPPHAADFRFEEGSLDLSDPAIAPYVRDFEEGAPLWEQTGVMLFHTSTDSLKFRDAYYRRIASAYLDRRSGMSYGFLSRQLPTPLGRALKKDAADALLGSESWLNEGVVRHNGNLHVRLMHGGQPMLVAVPTVRMLVTRSGCDKSHINGQRDLMLMELADGEVTFRTPRGMADVDYRPSYDTQTILAHGVGNGLLASVMAEEAADSVFLKEFVRTGAALAHWHGGLDVRLLPEGYHVFGAKNPPVSCSTHQSSFFALEGKLAVLGHDRSALRQYRGDVHIEPHHGINVTWPTLTGLARELLVWMRPAR